MTLVYYKKSVLYTMKHKKKDFTCKWFLSQKFTCDLSNSIYQKMLNDRQKWLRTNVCEHMAFQMGTPRKWRFTELVKISFSQMWVFMWIFNWDFWKNDVPQISQENGFLPVCLCRWLFKLEFSENADPQISQEKGFSPVCVRMWIFK